MNTVVREVEFSLNEFELVRRARDGSKEAFSELIRENKISMYKIAKNILKDEHNIGDAIAETIFKAYANINKLKNEEYFKTWLLRILINQCNEIHRKNAKVVFIGNQQEDMRTYDDSYEDIDLKNAIDSLDHELKLLVNLYYYEDLSLGDISKMLETPQGTLKSRLARARKSLYEMLKGE